MKQLKKTMHSSKRSQNNGSKNHSKTMVKSKTNNQRPRYEDDHPSEPKSKNPKEQRAKKFKSPKTQKEQDLSDFETVAVSDSDANDLELESGSDDALGSNGSDESSSSEDDYDQDMDIEKQVIDETLKAANRKGKKSGGFQSMGMVFVNDFLIQKDSASRFSKPLDTWDTESPRPFNEKQFP